MKVHTINIQRLGICKNIVRAILTQTIMMRIFSIFWIQMFIALPINAQEKEIARIFKDENINLYAEASTKYLNWIGDAASPNVGDREALIRHLRWITLITSEELPVNQSSRLLIAGQGTSLDANQIVSWWHLEDPIPSTLNNERLEEHLYRVYHAQRHYGFRKDSLGVDDRGRIFVRYGKPWRQDIISLKNLQLKTLPLEFRLPRNEIWVYRGMHDDAHYLFVQLSRRRPYKVGTSESLVPTNLRGSRRRVRILLYWMEDIFGQLAMQHDHYGSIYDAVSNYIALPTAEPYQPFHFSQRAIQDIRLRDDQHQLSRQKTLPPSQTQVYGNTIQLIPSLRMYRFLENNETTRLEIYWSIDVRDLRPSRYMRRRSKQLGYEISSDYILSVGLTSRSDNFEPENIQIRRYHLPDGASTDPQIYSWTVDNHSVAKPISLQWSLHWTVPDSILPQPDATWGIGIINLDTLDALKSDGASLELSDIKILSMDSPDTFDRVTPYVNHTIRPETQLALYFEAYFLRFDNLDKTNYTIEYTLSGKGSEPITTSFDYQGDSATVREFIAIDLSQWYADGPLSLTLTIIDHVAQQTASRAVDFEYER